MRMIKEGKLKKDLKEWANKYALEISRLLNRFCEPLDSVGCVSENQVQAWYKEIAKALELAALTLKSKDSEMP